MTPKEKAKELFKNIYSKIFNIDNGANVMHDKKRFDSAKECALIAVNFKLDNNFQFTDIEFGEDSSEYWKEVKKEIEAL